MFIAFETFMTWSLYKQIGLLMLGVVSALSTLFYLAYSFHRAISMDIYIMTLILAAVICFLLPAAMGGEWNWFCITGIALGLGVYNRFKDF